MAITELLPWKRRKKNVPVVTESRSPILELRREMDRLFDGVFRGFDMDPAWLFDRAIDGPIPRIDVREGRKDIRVVAELPGVDEKDISVYLDRGSLSIRGEKRSETENNDEGLYLRECRYGAFCRTIPLPEEVDEDRVSAKFKKGVLTVTLPKKKTAGRDTKKIEIRRT